MTGKEFLQQVFVAYKEIDSKIEQIARLQSLATRTTTVIKSIPCGKGTTLSSRVENAVLSIQGQTEYLAKEINHLLEVRREVSDAIAKVQNHDERIVLEYRYLCFYSWKQISHAMRMSLRTIFRLHDRALKNFSVLAVVGSEWQ